MTAEEVTSLCRKLAEYTEEPGHITRTFLSGPMHDVHRELTARMERLGMTVTVDAAGNLRGFYPPRNRAGPRLLIGSHLDTVPRAGAFDGILGVIMGLALVSALDGKRLPFGIEVIGFSEEEGVRFGFPFIGSRALAGSLDASCLERRDANGVSVADSIRSFGLDPARIPEAALPKDVRAYLEFHIEQGPELESRGFPLAVVEQIVGQSRLAFCFTGKAGHAGTTPMRLRQDALAAAAEWIGFVEDHALSVPGLVATVGHIEVEPNAGNVIAGAVRASLDVRHAYDAVRHQAVRHLVEGAQGIAKARRLQAEWEERLNQPAVAMNPGLVNKLSASVKATGFPVFTMPSGAGHDAMILAERVPSAMLFLRSPGGLSHHPNEDVLQADVAAALKAGLHFLENWDGNLD